MKSIFFVCSLHQCFVEPQNKQTVNSLVSLTRDNAKRMFVYIAYNAFSVEWPQSNQAITDLFWFWFYHGLRLAE